MKTGTPDTMKFKKLKRRLNVSLSKTVGTLDLLWMATAKSAPQGDIGRFSNEEIAIECDWDGDPDELVAALTECGWLDPHNECRLVVHDWADHAPNHVANNLKRWGKSFLIPPKESPKEPPKERPKDSPMEAPSSQAKPSQAKSNQITASQASSGSAGELAGGQAGLDFLALAGEEKIRDVVRQAKAIEKAFGRVLSSASEVWEIAWVGYSCREGFVPEIIERYKSLQGTDRAVKQPKRWLHGTLKKELEPFGVELDQAFASVVPWDEVKQ